MAFNLNANIPMSGQVPNMSLQPLAQAMAFKQNLRDNKIKQRMAEDQFKNQKTQEHKEKVLKSVLQSSMKMTPDGKKVVDKTKFVSGLHQAGLGQEAMQLEQKFAKEDQEKRTSFMNNQKMMLQAKGDIFKQNEPYLRAITDPVERANLLKDSYKQWKMDSSNLPDSIDDATLEQMTQSHTGREKFGMTPIWGVDKEGNPVASRMTSGGLQRMDMPEGVSQLTPGVDRMDLGSGVQLLGKGGQPLGYYPKTLKPGEQPTVKGAQAKAAEEGKIEAGVSAGTVVPKAESTLKAKKDLSSSLVRMKGLYDDLRKAGGIVDTEATGLSNFAARVKSSDIGQGVQNTLGTKEQSIRNEIKAIKPTLINAVRKASEMGAKGMDSEKELEFFLQTVTDEKKDFQSNIAAIAGLDRSLGLDMGMEITPQLEAKIAEIHAEYDRRKSKIRRPKPMSETPITGGNTKTNKTRQQLLDEVFD